MFLLKLCKLNYIYIHTLSEAKAKKKKKDENRFKIFIEMYELSGELSPRISMPKVLFV